VTGRFGAFRRVSRRAWLAGLAGLLVLALLAFDVSRPPARQVTARAALWSIRQYQAHLSPRLPTACRFTPTCSHYAAVVISRHGFVLGGWLAAKRVAKCGPWTRMGTVDLPE
jgi:uncharacterized protein